MIYLYFVTHPNINDLFLSFVFRLDLPTIADLLDGGRQVWVPGVLCAMGTKQRLCALDQILSPGSQILLAPGIIENLEDTDGVTGIHAKSKEPLIQQYGLHITSHAPLFPVEEVTLWNIALVP
jgi:hypothetical protein